MPELKLSQGSRKGTKADPFLDDNIEILITGLPTEDGHPQNSQWDYKMASSSGTNALGRIGPHYYASERFEVGNPVYGPSVLTIWNFADRYGDDLVRLTVRSHVGLPYEESATVYFIDAKYVADVPSPPPIDPPVDDPTDRSVRISAAGERLQITKSQRNDAVEAGALRLINEGTVLAHYVTELTTASFLAWYPFPDPPEEPTLSFKDPVRDPVLENPYRTIERPERRLVFDLHAGGQWRQLFIGNKQIFWTTNKGAAGQGDMLLTRAGQRVLAHGAVGGKWENDPIKQQLMPTQGSNSGNLRHVPISYSSTENSFECLTQLVDYWALPQTTKYLTRFYQTWRVSLIADQVLMEAEFYHLYPEPTYIHSYSLWFFPLSKYVKSITRPDGGSGWNGDPSFVNTPVLELVKDDSQIPGGKMLLLADVGGPYVGFWLGGAEGEPTGIVQEAVSARPADAYTVVSGKRWHANRKVEPEERLKGRLVISLDGDLTKARRILEGEVEPPNLDIHKVKAAGGMLARMLDEAWQGEDVSATRMREILDEEMASPSLDRI